MAVDGGLILSPKLVLQGTRFHSDLALMEELNLLSDRAVILADNVLKPGAPLYIWHLAKGSCLDICHSICICILLSIFLSFFDHKYIYINDYKHIHAIIYIYDLLNCFSLFHQFLVVIFIGIRPARKGRPPINPDYNPYLTVPILSNIINSDN